MELVYIINDKRDFDRFVSIYPDAKWQGSGPFIFDTLTHLMGHSLINFPMALYYRPDGRVQWSRYNTALDLTTQSPFKYQWGELWPKLSTIDIFRKFLQHHDAYDAFEASCKYLIHKNRTLLPCNFISYAFNWSHKSAEKNVYYWQGLSQKWQKLINDLEIPNIPVDNFYTQLFIIDGETNDNT